jgi:hypothetical protein
VLLMPLRAALGCVPSPVWERTRFWQILRHIYLSPAPRIMTTTDRHTDSREKTRLHRTLTRKLPSRPSPPHFTTTAGRDPRALCLHAVPGQAPGKGWHFSRYFAVEHQLQLVDDSQYGPYVTNLTPGSANPIIW